MTPLIQDKSCFLQVQDVGIIATNEQLQARIRNASNKVLAELLANGWVNPKFSAAYLSRSCAIRTRWSINSTLSGLGLRNVIVNAGFPEGCISLCNNQKWVCKIPAFVFHL